MANLIFPALGFVVLLGILFFMVEAYSLKGLSAIASNPWKKDALLVGLISAVSAVLVVFAGLLGFRWDEHLIQWGGFQIAEGRVPYLDFGLPLGPVVFYLQSVGNILFDGMLAYSFSAAILQAILIFVSGMILRRSLGLRWVVILPLLGIFHFAFFGISGCLWYNQLGAYIFTLLVLGRYFLAPRIGYFGLLVLESLGIAAIILTKHDIGILALLFFCIWILIDSWTTDRRKGMLSASILLVGSVGISVAVIALFQALGGSPMQWLNVGQEGFAKRIMLDARFLVLSFLSLFDLDLRQSFKQSGLLLNHAVLIFAAGIWYWGGRRQVRLLALLVGVAIVSYIINTTSGKGAGFVLSHYLPLMLVLFLDFLKRSGVEEVRSKPVVFLVLLTALAGCIGIEVKNSFVRYEFTNKVLMREGAFQGMIVTPETASLFSGIESAIQAARPEQAVQGGKSTILEVNFYYYSPHLETKLYNNALWYHEAISMRTQDVIRIAQDLTADPCDFILIPDRDLDLPFNAPFKAVVSSGYTRVVHGNVHTIGTGGGANAIAISLYQRLPKQAAR